MKKTYQNPFAEIVLLQPGDVIATSFPSAAEGEGEIVNWIIE